MLIFILFPCFSPFFQPLIHSRPSLSILLIYQTGGNVEWWFSPVDGGGQN